MRRPEERDYAERQQDFLNRKNEPSKARKRFQQLALQAGLRPEDLDAFEEHFMKSHSLRQGLDQAIVYFAVESWRKTRTTQEQAASKTQVAQEQAINKAQIFMSWVLEAGVAEAALRDFALYFYGQEKYCVVDPSNAEFKLVVKYAAIDWWNENKGRYNDGDGHYENNDGDGHGSVDQVAVETAAVVKPRVSLLKAIGK